MSQVERHRVRQPLRILLGDDQILFVDLLASVLRDRGHEVRTTATTRAELVECAGTFGPDICIVDPFAAGAGADAIRDVLAAWASTCVVVLTASTDEDLIREAFAAGARGYLHKSRGVDAVLQACGRVLAGETLVELARPQRPRRRPMDRGMDVHRLAAHLTAREAECLGLLAAGQDTTAIGRRLGVSPATVRTHVQAVLTKLGVNSRLQAASLALRYGLAPHASAAVDADTPADVPPPKTALPSARRTAPFVGK